MGFLIAAVVFVGLLCMFDLVLTLGVLRRLREHTAELERLAGRSIMPSYDPGVLVGRALPEDVAGPRLVAFFDVGCDTCHERAPQFAAAVGGQAALAVITGDAAKVGDLVEVVGGVSDVVTGEDADRIAHAVGVEAFPTFLRTGSDGRIVAADTEPVVLTAMARAR
ncbi:hypothetical protein ABZ297_46520 [Nonomuraea sp. NPDC005983]|uniref:hypothetical protein n=1 Tax=Nonomuraea sp. NPDC005983 TaxID=3155595 RepID=UPI00339E6E05